MKKVFILGGHGDIGSAIVEKFAECGFEIIAPTSKELDLSDRDSLEKYFKNNQQDIDVLIQCAGFNSPKLLEEIDFCDVDKTLAINTVSFYRIIKHFLPSLKKNQGHILSISSLYGFLARSGRLSYVMSKHALVGLTKTLAIELGPFNIKVNALSPGFVDTKMTRKNNSLEKIKDFESKIPLGHLASTKEIAEVAYFLCSDKNQYITGHDLVVDGGFSIGGFQK